MNITKLLFIAMLLVLHGCCDSTIKLAVNPETASGTRGQSLTFSATEGVAWAVSGGVEATTISSEGVLTIGQFERAELLKVTATSLADTLNSVPASVIVLDPMVYGPAGGIVFYDKGEYSDGWRYLEATPKEYEFTAEWGLKDVDCTGTSTKIGTGKVNTAKVIRFLEEHREAKKAAQLCAELTINGYSDWFLPSYDELLEMVKKYTSIKYLEEFQGDSGWYWSSSIYERAYYIESYTGRRYERSIRRNYGTMAVLTRYSYLHITPIRYDASLSPPLSPPPSSAMNHVPPDIYTGHKRDTVLTVRAVRAF